MCFNEISSNFMVRYVLHLTNTYSSTHKINITLDKILDMAFSMPFL